MTEPRDLRELVGDGVSEEELERLRAVDALLRAVPPPPPEVPQSLARAVAQTAAAPAPAWTRSRVAATVALAASLALVSFGLGTRLGGDGFDERARVAMEPAAEARGASALIRIGEPDEYGNWKLRLEARGLPRLPAGGYYVLWLAKDGEYAGTCGTFAVGEGETEAEWTVSYPLQDYDAWVVTAYRPGQQRAGAGTPWLLQAKVRA